MKKLLATFLAAIMAVTWLPSTAIAEGDETLIVGKEGYSTIQQAVNTALGSGAGTKTILIKAGTYDETVEILQDPNVDLVLQGESGNVFTGKMIIDGGGNSKGTDKLDIRNIKFDQSGKSTPVDYIINMTKLSKSEHTYSYTHNVTIENCEFVGKGAPTFAINAGTSDGNHAFNVVVRNCTFSNLDCVVQARCTGLTLENITANVRAGINSLNSTNITLKNVKIHASEYGFRMGETQYSSDCGQILIENSELKSSSENPERGVLVIRKSAIANIAINSSDIVGHLYNTSDNISIVTDDVYWGKNNTYTGFKGSQLITNNDAELPHWLPKAGSSEISASVDVAYTVVITSSINFGTLNRDMDRLSKDFTVSIEDALVEDNSKVVVKVTNAELAMRDSSGNQALDFELEQPGGIFEFPQEVLADGEESITSAITCNPAKLEAAGSYKCIVNFEISYVK